MDGSDLTTDTQIDLTSESVQRFECVLVTRCVPTGKDSTAISEYHLVTQPKISRREDEA